MVPLWDVVRGHMVGLRNAARMSITEPCVGLGAARELFKQTGCAYIPVNTYDIDARFALFWERRMGEGFPGKVGLGREDGDICKVPIAELKDSQGFVAGPPCQGFANNGQHLGALDPRTRVYEVCVDWVSELAHRGCLLWVALENSPNMLKRIGGQPSYMDGILSRLNAEIPFFHWDCIIEALQEYFPHVRTRSWLRGMRIDALLCGGKIPKPIGSQAFHCKLVDLLTPGLPNIDPQQLTEKRKRNLEQYLSSVADCMKVAWETNPDWIPIACIDIDRAFDRTFSPVVYYDKIPSLRCNAPEIFLVSTEDLQMRCHLKKFMRFLTDAERFYLQGHEDYSGDFKTRKAKLSATGNAYATLMFASVVVPMMTQTIITGASKRTRLTPEDLRSLTSTALTDARELARDDCPPGKRHKRSSQ